MRVIIGKHRIATLVSIISKLLSAFMQIMITPLLISKLGVSDFAIYNFLIGISAWLILLDLSTGTIIQNRIAKNEVNNISSNEIINYFFYFMVILVIVCCLILFGLTPLVLKLFLERISGHFSYNLIFVWLFFSLGYVSNILFQNVIKIYYALGFSFKINILNLIANFTTFILLTLVTQLNFSYLLPVVIILSVISSILVNIYAFIVINRSNTKLNWRKFIQFITDLIFESRHFLLFTISGMLVLQLDYFLIAYFLSARDLIEYNFISRVFMAAFGFYSIILTNFYPVCAKLTYSHEWGLLKKHTIQHLTIGFLLVIFSLLCFMFARDQLSRYFLKNSVDLQLSIIVMFGIYYFIRVWTDTFAVLLTILNQGNYMFKIVIFQIMISAPLQVLLIRKFELIGLMVGLIFSFIPTSAVFFPKMVMKFSKVRIG